MSNQEVKIEGIRPSLNKPETHVSVQLGCEIKAPSNMTGVASLFNKGGDFTSRRVAFQTMELSVIDGKGVKIGANISDVIGEDLSIQVTEVADSELQAQREATADEYAKYVAKVEADADRDNSTIASIEKYLGFQKKLHGGTKAEMTINGENIWRKSQLVFTADLNDTLLVADKVEETVAVKA